MNKGKGKPHKGIRVDELGAATGYRFIVLMRIHDPNEKIAAEFGVGMNGFAAILHEMLQVLHDAGYRGLQYLGDNLYMTPKIMGKIEEDMDYRGVGTWRPNYGVWAALTLKGTKQVKATRSVAAGRTEKWTVNLAFENGITCTAINENGEFYMMSNVEPQFSFVEYPRKESTWDDSGAFTGYKHVVDKKLTPQNMYNKGKTGVDQVNQLLMRSMPRAPHTRRFTLPAYLGVDGAACVALHAIHQYFAKALGVAADDRLDFQKSLGCAMCRYHPSLFEGFPEHAKMGRAQPVPRRWTRFETWMKKYVSEMQQMSPPEVFGAPPAPEPRPPVAERSAKRRKTSSPGSVGCSGHTLVGAERCQASPRKTSGPSQGQLVRAAGGATKLLPARVTCAVCKTRGQMFVCPPCGVGFCDPDSKRLGGAARQCFWEHTVIVGGKKVLVHTPQTATLRPPAHN